MANPKIHIRIATRASDLALWQSRHVASLLEALDSGIETELVPITTSGDRIIDRPLNTIGGKGLFIKELEVAMLQGQADIAVHSMKDLPAQLEPEFVVASILPREDPRDALVSTDGHALMALPAGAVVGTSSLRRRSQLLAARPDLEIRDLRGNVPTRLEKLQRGQYDAVVLACAGLRRLERFDQTCWPLPTDIVLPAVAQGAIGIECLRDNETLRELLGKLACPATSACVAAERAMNATLGGSCTVPIAGMAQLVEQSLRLSGLVASLDGSQIVAAELHDTSANATSLGEAVAAELLAAGAAEILQALGNE